jgi:hypothetical protein
MDMAWCWRRLWTSVAVVLASMTALVCMLAAENYYILRVSAWQIDWTSLLYMSFIFLAVSLIPRRVWLLWTVAGIGTGMLCMTLTRDARLQHKTINAVELGLLCFSPVAFLFVMWMRQRRRR